MIYLIYYLSSYRDSSKKLMPVIISSVMRTSPGIVTPVIKWIVIRAWVIIGTGAIIRSVAIIIPGAHSNSHTSRCAGI